MLIFSLSILILFIYRFVFVSPFFSVFLPVLLFHTIIRLCGEANFVVAVAACFSIQPTKQKRVRVNICMREASDDAMTITSRYRWIQQHKRATTGKTRARSLLLSIDCFVRSAYSSFFRVKFLHSKHV